MKPNTFALFTLLASVALSGCAYEGRLRRGDDEVTALTISGLHPAYLQYEGDYHKQSNAGDSAHGCWNQVHGNNSLGAYGGHWYVINTPDCTLANGSASYYIGAAQSADPTASSTVEWTY